MAADHGRGAPAPRPSLLPQPTWGARATAVPACVSPLRRALVAFAASHRAGPETQGAIALAASEAITNAVLHAYVDTTPGTVTVAAAICDDCLLVSVADDGRGMRPRTDSPGLGLGLPTIAQLAASVTIEPGHDGRGTVVRLEFPLD